MTPTVVQDSQVPDARRLSNIVPYVCNISGYLFIIVPYRCNIGCRQLFCVVPYGCNF